MATMTLTREQIERMEAGPGLDAMIQNHVMHSMHFAYSTSGICMIELIDKMVADGWAIEVRQDRIAAMVRFHRSDENRYWAVGKTIMHAAAKSALLSTLEARSNGE